MLHLFSKFAHGLLRDGAPLTTGEGAFRVIDRCEYFRTGALPLLPQGKCFFHRVFLALEPTAFNGLADKSFLIVADLDMRDRLRIHPSRVKKVELIEKKPAGFILSLNPKFLNSDRKALAPPFDTVLVELRSRPKFGRSDSLNHGAGFSQDVTE